MNHNRMSCAPIYDSIVCFGDSLTSFAVPSGFLSRLQALYDRRLEVLCRGFSGYTTREASKLAPRLFVANQSQSSQGRVALTILWFGANDAALQGHRQHNPLPSYISELHSIVSTIHNAIQQSSRNGNLPNKTRILILTPPPVFDNPSLEGARHSKQTKLYAEAVMNLDFSSLDPEVNENEKAKIVKLDVHSLFLEKSKLSEGGLKELLKEDGLHVSQKGYDVLYEALVPFIKTNFPELDPQSLPMIIPRWSHLNRETTSEDLERQLRTPSMD